MHHRHRLHSDSRQSEVRRLSLLPHCSYSVAGVTVPLTPRNQRLLSLLAVTPYLRMSREQAAATLWPDSTRYRAQCSLRTTLREIRQIDPLLVMADPAAVALSADVSIDLLNARKTAADIASGSLARPDDRQVDLMAQPLLHGWVDDWVAMEQVLFDQMRVHALEVLAARFTADGEHARAVRAGLLAFGCDRLRESAHRVLIEAYLAEGNVAAAVSQLTTLEMLLESELGLRPSPDVRGRVFDAMAAVR